MLITPVVWSHSLFFTVVSYQSHVIYELVHKQIRSLRFQLVVDDVTM